MSENDNYQLQNKDEASVNVGDNDKEKLVSTEQNDSATNVSGSGEGSKRSTIDRSSSLMLRLRHCIRTFRDKVFSAKKSHRVDKSPSLSKEHDPDTTTSTGPVRKENDVLQKSGEGDSLIDKKQKKKAKKEHSQLDYHTMKEHQECPNQEVDSKANFFKAKAAKVAQILKTNILHQERDSISCNVQQKASSQIAEPNETSTSIRIDSLCLISQDEQLDIDPQQKQHKVKDIQQNEYCRAKAATSTPSIASLLPEAASSSVGAHVSHSDSECPTSFAGRSSSAKATTSTGATGIAHYKPTEIVRLTRRGIFLHESDADYENNTKEGGVMPLKVAPWDSLLQRKYGYSPLHLAAGRGDYNTTLALINDGADLEACDYEGRTPMHLAAGNIVCGLDSYWRLYASRYKKWHYPVMHDHRDSDKGHEKVVKLLTSFGANVNSIDASRRTPLHLAARMGSPTTLKTLLAMGGDVSARDNVGATAVYAAAAGARSVNVTILAQAGADVNVPIEDGSTPLHIAAHSSYPEVVRALLLVGADRNARDFNGHAARHVSTSLLVDMVLARRDEDMLKPITSEESSRYAQWKMRL